MIYYCGLNQFIVQRNLAAKTLSDGQLGMIFAGALWLLVPFAIVMPGIMAANLYPEAAGGKIRRRLPDADQPPRRPRTPRLHLRRHRRRHRLHPRLVAQFLRPPSPRSTSTSGCSTPRPREKTIVRLGRVLTLVFVVIGCITAPLLQLTASSVHPAVPGLHLAGRCRRLPRCLPPAPRPGRRRRHRPVARPLSLRRLPDHSTRKACSPRFSTSAILHMHFLIQVLACLRHHLRR